MESTVFFVPLDADRELMIEVTVREFNGVSSDPKVFSRRPCIEDLNEALEAAKGLRKIRFSTSLDYPQG